MNVTIKLDDDLADDYREEVTKRQVALNEILAERLRAALPLDPTVRYLIVRAADRQRLETILGGLPLRDVNDLVTRTGRLAQVKFGDHRLELTPAHIEEVGRMATKQSKPVGRVLSEMWDRFCEEFFVRIPTLK